MPPKANCSLAFAIRFSDRSAGDRDLKDAKENFQKLLESSTTLPEIRERALFGMARTEESTSDGDLKKFHRSL